MTFHGNVYITSEDLGGVLIWVGVEFFDTHCFLEEKGRFGWEKDGCSA